MGSDMMNSQSAPQYTQVDLQATPTGTPTFASVGHSEYRPIYESGMRWDWWLLAPLYIFCFALLIGITVWMAVLQAWVSCGIIAAITGFTVVLMLLVLPKNVQVWSDRIQVNMLLCGSIRMPFSDIRSVEAIELFTFYPAFKLGTSLSNRVMVKRSSGCLGMGVLFCPKDRDEFLRVVRQHIMGPNMVATV